MTSFYTLSELINDWKIGSNPVRSKINKNMFFFIINYCIAFVTTLYLLTTLQNYPIGLRF